MMDASIILAPWWASILGGVASGALALWARRAPLVAWAALAPLGLALATTGWWAALGGALFGAVLHGAATRQQPPSLRPLGPIFGAVGWGLASGLAGASLEHADVAALAVALPACAYVATLPMRRAGAPRWIHAALACTQEPWPVVVQTGRVGGELTVTLLLTATSASLVLLLPGSLARPFVAVPTLALVAAMVLGAAAWQRRVHRTIGRAPRIRVAAVVVDGAPPKGAPDGLWPMRSPEYRDVPGTIARYTPHLTRAAAQGAEVLVLPEVAVVIDDATRDTWIQALAHWARSLGVTVVAGHLDESAPSNTVHVVTSAGRTWSRDKQHPAPGIEPAPRTIGPPAPHRLEAGWSLSTVVCVDLDYPDLLSHVRASGGLLVVPSNDWAGGFERVHDRSAVWAAVLTGTSVLRATGHGISSVRDGAGRLLGSATSLEGPVVLVVDVPVVPPHAR